MNRNPSRYRLSLACNWLASGGVIAYPTEAVYGLGCEPANPDAVSRLLRLKQRSVRKGLILIAADWEQLQPWLAAIPDRLEKKMRATWPGPVTWLAPAAGDCPAWLTGEHSTLAVRVSAHPGVAQLCRHYGGAIVSTSANRSGRAPARTPLQIRLQFGSGIDYLLAGTLGGLGGPTEIRDLLSEQVVREQPVTDTQ